jgi:uncharacterized protein DUF2637
VNRTIVVRLGALGTGLVALGSAVLSWDALSWGAGQLGVDPRLTWLYPVVIDGTILVGTVAALALRRARYRIRGYVWTLLIGAIGASVVGNGAHAAAGSLIHVVGAAVPAVALAASLHLLVILVRHAPASSATEVQPPAGEPASAPLVPPVPVAGLPSAMGSVDEAPGRDPNRIARVPARAEVRRLLRRHGDALAVERVTERTGVSIRHAKKLLREELAGLNDGRRPHLLQAEEAAPAAAAQEG